jgi:hypothetical protein
MALGTFWAETAMAQIKPALVRSVDEPARVPYDHTLSLVCPYANVCTATGPAVPAGKRLRVTNIAGTLTLQPALVNSFVAFHIGAVATPPLVAFPVPLVSLAYYGNSLSFSHQINFHLEAGEVPIVELGTHFTVSFSGPTSGKVTISGYVVDVAP